MKQVFGTFILSENDNEYRGEYFNNHSTQFFDEKVQVVNSRNSFVGTFQTEWKESGQKYAADLSITQRDNVYYLNWTKVRKGDEVQSVIFAGRGVIKEGKLITVYEMRTI